MNVRKSAARPARSIGRIGQRRQVVIPKAICEKLGLREGDFVEVAESNDRIVIRPKKLVDLEDTLTPEEEKIVARGFKQLKQGKYVTWDQLKRELGVLKSRTAGYKGR